jgi:hypothetical protein
MDGRFEDFVDLKSKYRNLLGTLLFIGFSFPLIFAGAPTPVLDCTNYFCQGVIAY